MELIDENFLKFVGLVTLLGTAVGGILGVIHIAFAFYDAKVILDKLKDKYLK